MTLRPAARRPAGKALRPRSRSMKKVGSSSTSSGRFGVDTQHAQQVFTGHAEFVGQIVEVSASLERRKDRLKANATPCEDRQAEGTPRIDNDVRGTVFRQVNALCPAIGGEFDPT